MTKATYPLTIPKLGLTMTDCTLVDWFKENGDKVSKGDLIYTVETDKIATDVEAESTGFLQRIAEPDTLLEVGDIVGFLHETNEAASQAAAKSDPVSIPAPTRTDEEPRAETEKATTMRADLDNGKGRILISPVARRVAAQAGLNISVVSGTGPG
ncbi:MAG: E3 binding domain-containing protein, partial [Fimbriimonadaceae bacterium]|nr:E3 binding domain-containing protein [Alphaproteobacteria bacterium]